MVYLIGVAHRAQSRQSNTPLTEAQKQFEAVLRKAIADHAPVLVAEEDSEEALAARNSVSIAKGVAQDKQLEHRFCDPTIAQRQKLHYQDGHTLQLQLFMSDQVGLSDDEIMLKGRAIEIGRYFPIRERFWFERIPEATDQPVIFICGDAHIESFHKLLDTEKIPHEIFGTGIGLTEEDSWFPRAVRYLRDHPEVLDEDPNML